MNTILALVKTRYMLYVEDDWWAIRRNSTQHPIWSTHNFLWRAMNVLKNGAECVSQARVRATCIARNGRWVKFSPVKLTLRPICYASHYPQRCEHVLE